jgi:ferredoxin-NADP reductase/ferredoxin
VTAFKIEFTPSGDSFEAATGETVLDAALRQGVQLPYGCRNGRCSTCKFQVEDGEVDFGDVSVYSLPEAERDEGWALLCRATALTDLLIRDNRLPDARARPLLRPLQVAGTLAGVRALTAELFELSVRVHAPLGFYPGQFMELGLGEGAHQVWRSYSIASPPSAAPDLQFVIKRIENGAFSSRLAELAAGTPIRLRGPYGDSYLRDGDRPIVLCAIGSGIAPILSMLHAAAQAQDRRPIRFFYGARRAADLPYVAQLAGLFAGLAPGSTFEPTLDGIAPDDPWTGTRGNVVQAIQRGVSDAHRYDAYLCGAPPMCDAVSRLLLAKGLSSQALFMDRFFTTSRDAQPESA